MISLPVGKKFEGRHQQFRRYFASQHLYKPTVPPITTHLNWKVDHFMKHLNGLFIQTAMLPKRLSVDEQTIMFHGTSNVNKLAYKIQKNRWWISVWFHLYKWIHYLSPSILLSARSQKNHWKGFITFSFTNNVHVWPVKNWNNVSN